jgi:hypothetical protein
MRLARAYKLRGMLGHGIGGTIQDTEGKSPAFAAA